MLAFISNNPVLTTVILLVTVVAIWNIVDRVCESIERIEKLKRQ